MCKSKGGLTRHVRSKHISPENPTVEAGKGSTGRKQIPSYITEEKVLSLIREIAKSLTDEKIYPETYVTRVFDLKPSKSFIENVNGLLHKFHRKNDRDRFMKDYFGTMYRSWKEYFHPFSDQKVVFLMLVNLPERLITLILKESESLKSISGHTVCKFRLYKVHWVR